MQRHLANIGIKAITGKNLNDFDGYDYSEGAFVSGGVEAVMAFDAVVDSERKARRFQALSSFCKWLKKERPDLYKHLSPTL